MLQSHEMWQDPEPKQKQHIKKPKQFTMLTSYLSLIISLKLLILFCLGFGLHWPKNSFMLGLRKYSWRTIQRMNKLMKPPGREKSIQELKLSGCSSCKQIFVNHALCPIFEWNLEGLNFYTVNCWFMNSLRMRLGGFPIIVHRPPTLAEYAILKFIRGKISFF